MPTIDATTGRVLAEVDEVQCDEGSHIHEYDAVAGYWSGTMYVDGNLPDSTDPSGARWTCPTPECPGHIIVGHVSRCDAPAIKGTGVGTCDALVDQHDTCPNAANHLEI